MIIMKNKYKFLSKFDMTDHVIDVTSKDFVEKVIKGSENLPVIVDLGLHGVHLVNN